MNWILKFCDENDSLIKATEFESYDEALKSINVFQLNSMGIVHNVYIMNRVGVCHFQMTLN